METEGQMAGWYGAPAEVVAMPHVDRRLVAIMASDIVGYSRLIEADEARTLAAIRDLRCAVIDPLLAEHHGRIVKLMGDGAIVEFGSVVDAVACAAAMQDGVAARQAEAPVDRHIVFRVGINLGDVVVEGSDLLGDGVNVAARLEQLCAPGGVLISGTAYDHLQGKLDLPVDYAGEHHVKNIARPIRTYRVRLGETKQRQRLDTRPFRRWLPAAAALLVAILAGGIWQFWPAGAPALRRSGIAILPFDNLSGDQATRWLADGLAEEIIIDLAHFRDLDVIARNSTATFTGESADVQRVGKVLNVGYVLEGSMQRQGERIRIAAQLVDAGTGAQVWSNRWDRPAEDIFAVQSELAEQVAANLGAALGLRTIAAGEVQRAKRRTPADLTAYIHYLRAAESQDLRSPATGLDPAERAIALDPNFARAYTVRGWLRYFTIAHDDDWKRTIDLVGDDFRRAVALDPADADARAAFGSYLAEKGRLAEAAVEFDRALAQGPSNAHVLAVASNGLAYLGQPEKAAMLANRALRLDPRMSPTTIGALKEAYFYTRSFGRVIEIVNAVPESSRSRWARLYLAASYAMLGYAEEATAAKVTLIAKHGEKSAEQWLNEGAVFARSAEEDLFVDGIRKLGLPICAKSEELLNIPNPRRLPDCVPHRPWPDRGCGARSCRRWRPARPHSPSARRESRL
jgi:TolB-like protein/class 3 adenylate cyclase